MCTEATAYMLYKYKLYMAYTDADMYDVCLGYFTVCITLFI